MSHITIECPDCHREHTASLSDVRTHCGGFNCECGNVLLWDVKFAGAWWARHSDEQKGVQANG